ncbi:MAG: lipid-transfer protein [bacterium TMED88]|nr:lipid-transfer protein [Deltaproteobacteria bacterium]OUV34659.1 MAG: lipid-transfer protein [bacterium TMED88]
MPTTLKNEAAIVGIGETEYSKNSGRSELALASEAVAAAIRDAGLSPSDIDGMTTFTMDTSDEIEVARAVGIKDLTFFSRVPHGGGAAIGVMHQAVMAVATGSAKAVVVYRALNGRSGARYSEGVSGGPTTSDLIHWSWYMPSGLMTPASWVAMFTQRYMQQTGCTSADLAEICLAQREHAVKNPRAFFYEKPLTFEEHQSARPIVEPLRLYDCCQETDGGAACVVVSPEWAKDLPHKPAVVRAVAQGAAGNQESMTSFYRPEIAEIPSMDIVARQCWEISGLTPDDIDCAVIYDAFSSIVLWQLESFGFCKKGEARDFIQDGALRLGGKLPTNTHGGQLSEAYVHGMNGVNEGVRLIRGTSTSQPDKNEHVVVTAGVGIPTSAMILGQS